MRNIVATSTFGLLCLSGCASGSTMVLTPPPSEASYEAVSIQRGDDTVEVPQEVAQRFEETLTRLLLEDGDHVLEQGGLILSYRFIQNDPGSQAARYFIGFGAGRGELTVEIDFLDPAGNQLAEIQSGGEIMGGLFGGSYTQAIDRAAMETAEYVDAYFD